MFIEVTNLKWIPLGGDLFCISNSTSFVKLKPFSYINYRGNSEPNDDENEDRVQILMPSLEPSLDDHTPKVNFCPF